MNTAERESNTAERINKTERCLMHFNLQFAICIHDSSKQISRYSLPSSLTLRATKTPSRSLEARLRATFLRSSVRS
jgi:hypothetical protein